jgi:hypothetical protein
MSDGATKGRSAATRSSVGDAAATLLAHMTTILGGAIEARVRLAAALREAGLTAIPEDPAVVMVFVRTFLVEPLSTLCGPRLTARFVEDVERLIVPRSDVRLRPRAEGDLGELKPRVGLVDDEPFRRSSVARALLHAGLDVIVLEPEQILATDVDVLVALGDAADPEVLRDLTMPIVRTQANALAGEVVVRSTAPRDIAEAVRSLVRNKP